MRALVATSVASMVDQFLKPSIRVLQDLGYEVMVVTNFDQCGNISIERCEELKRYLTDNNVTYQQVDFPRSPFKIFQLFRSFSQMRNLLKSKTFDLCHCHSPIGGLVARVECARQQKNGLKVIYTAHGFHFYAGAPLKNWLIYYPIEWLCAHWTDTLITINKEDYALAQQKMKAKRIAYVPGVGIDVEKFANTVVDREAKRAEIGVPSNAFLILSVGELNVNKNHQVIIRAMANINDNNIHFAVAGKGDQRIVLERLASGLGISNQLHFLGYREDVAELYKTADLYALPSIREGLNVSVMEALSSGLPCIVSRIRGNVDIVKEGDNGYYFNPFDYESVEHVIISAKYKGKKKEKSSAAAQFGEEMIIEKMKSLYKECWHNQ